MGRDTLACGDVQTGLAEAERHARADGALLVAAGSLYLVGGIRALLTAGR